jgi:hypothetical protein
LLVASLVTTRDAVKELALKVVAYTFPVTREFPLVVTTPFKMVGPVTLSDGNIMGRPYIVTNMTAFVALGRLVTPDDRPPMLVSDRAVALTYDPTTYTLPLVLVLTRAPNPLPCMVEHASTRPPDDTLIRNISCPVAIGREYALVVTPSKFLSAIAEVLV